MMLKGISFTSISLLLITGGARAENLQECIAEYDPSIDYFPNKAVVEVAELFTVEYHDYFKIVRNLDDKQTYVLVQCGAPTPSTEELEAVNATSLSDISFTLEVPLFQVALEYSTMEAFFEMLGARRRVQAILGQSYSTSSCMVDLVDGGQIVEIENVNASESAAYVNEEGLLETNPNLAQPFSVDSLVGFVGRSLWNPRTYPFPYIRTSDTLEPSREGLFESVKFYSTFLNLEERANEVWDQIQERLECVQTNAAAAELEAGKKTKVLWGSYSGRCGAWDVARNGPFYYHDFAEVCSAELLSAELGGTLEVESCSTERKFMSVEEFVEFAKDADVWIWPSPSRPPLDDTEIFTDEVKQLKAYQQLYYAGGSVGWFDQVYMQPDVLIEDFCDLAGTLQLENGVEYERKWFISPFTDPKDPINPTCEDLGGIDTPRDSAGSDCTRRTTEQDPTPAPTPAPASDSTETPSTARSSKSFLSTALFCGLLLLLVMF